MLCSTSLAIDEGGCSIPVSAPESFARRVTWQDLLCISALASTRASSSGALSGTPSMNSRVQAVGA